MIVPLLMLAAQPAAAAPETAPPPDSVRVAVVDGRLDIPDEIAAAVVPYMRCLIASSGVPVYTEGRKALIPPPAGIGKGSDCSAHRSKAARDADYLLKQAGKGPRSKRALYIDKVLASIDAFHWRSSPPARKPEMPK